VIRRALGRLPGRRRRSRGQDGAALVEAALAIPIVFVLLSGTVDVGLWVFERTQVSNAARDGVRAAILEYATADSPGTFASTDNLAAGSADAAVQAAVASHLSGRAFNVTVACYTAGTATTTPCSSADPANGDEIEVTVTANRPSYSFFGPVFWASTVTASATLPVVGLPVPVTTTTTP
jgi:Flp pilus assembly protein TadG